MFCFDVSVECCIAPVGLITVTISTLEVVGNLLLRSAMCVWTTSAAIVAVHFFWRANIIDY